MWSRVPVQTTQTFDDLDLDQLTQVHSESIWTHGRRDSSGLDSSKLHLHDTGAHHYSGDLDQAMKIEIVICNNQTQEPDERADVAEYDMYNIMEENDQLRAKIEVKILNSIFLNEYHWPTVIMTTTRASMRSTPRLVSRFSRHFLTTSLDELRSWWQRDMREEWMNLHGEWVVLSKTSTIKC